MLDSKYQVDKRLVRESFDRAAPDYDAVAVVQREVGQRLLERLELIKLEPQRILDLGAGTGMTARALGKRYRKAELIALDIAPAMLRQARRQTGWFSKQRFVCGDAESLALADDSVDLIISNLTLQWCQQPERVFRECLRVLRPNGLLLFSTLGPDTLKELRASWQAVDGHNHVNAFVDMHDIGDALLQVRFADPVTDIDRITMTYQDVYTLMRELKTLGAHNVTAGRAHGLTGKGRLQAMAQAYEAFRSDGMLPASYEVVYGLAWVPEVKRQPAANADGSFSFPLEQLRGSRRGHKTLGE